MTPLEQLQSLMQQVPYAVSMSIQVEQADDSGTRCRMKFQQHQIGNPLLPALHGGAVSSLLESCGIVEIMRNNLADGDDSLPLPVSITIEYLRSAGPHDLIGHAEIVKRGRRVTHVRVIAWQDNPDKPVAAMHGHFLAAHPAD